MKLFSKFPTVNISQIHFLSVICIAKNLILTTLKAILHPPIPDFQIVVSVKYCPILTNHTQMGSLFEWISNLTIMTDFVVEGHIYWTIHKSMFHLFFFFFHLTTNA